jgi:hypothetical protein
MQHEPDLNALAALAEQRLPQAERDALLEHAAGCRACREILAALTRASGGERTTAQAWSRPRFWMPVAATLAIAAVGTVMLTRQDRAPAGHEASRSSSTSTPAPTAAAPSAAAPLPAPPEAPGPTEQPESLERRRGATRNVSGKVFRLEAGTWVDSTYDETAGLPVVDITSRAQERDVVSRLPSLKPYVALGPHVVVVWRGTVYRFTLS